MSDAGFGYDAARAVESFWKTIMRRFIPFFFLAVALFAAFLVYRPGLSGPFLFDDGPNIIRNDRLAIHELSPAALKQAAFSGFSGPLLRPLSMMSFALNSFATGLDPYYFKLTNLAIHLVNGVGVFVLTWLLLGFYRKRFEPDLSIVHVQWVSLAVATAWLLHPFNLTSVLYVVQRMNSLSALFSIWGLALFLRGRTRLYEGRNGWLAMLAALMLLTPMAAFSKENGILLPLLMLVTEVTLFGFYTEKPSARRFLIILYVLSVAIPAAIALGYLATHSEWLLAGYKTRDFTLIERVMTEARVMWFYIWQILLPSTAQMGLYHDDIAISRGWLQPFSTVPAIAGVIGLLALSFVARKKAPLIAFGVLFFLAGHSLESTIWPLEIAHEHRNYLPMYGILLILFFYVLYPLKYVNYLRLRQTFAVLLIGLLAFNTFARAGKWANPHDLFLTEVEHHPESALANGEMGAVYSSGLSSDPFSIDNKYNAARGHFETAVKLDKNDAKPLFALIMLNVSMGKPIEQAWLQELTRRLETAPYAAITSDKLNTLTECQLEGFCKLANSEFEGLLRAALRNPTLSGVNRAKVLDALSSYTIKVVHDNNAALGIMRQMVQAAPQVVTYRFALIDFLIAMNRFDEAREQLAILKKLDTLQDHSAKIASQELILSKQGNHK
ncbi:MAG: tetratricopeptide repeat protein [Gallionella sp.]|nr:tetratricopeptide repeat protein [Gallionella sp.]